MTIGSMTGIDWAGCSYFSTLREGGVSLGAWDGLNLGAHCHDQAAAVAENRARLRLDLPADPFWLTQVHGVRVVDADVASSAAPEADAAVSTAVNRVLAILTADCLPVVISDYRGSVLGVAHAGWRGLAAGVLEATLDSMQAKRPDHGRLRAWIGPAISQRHFEVGAEVLEAMLAKDADAAIYFVPADIPGKYHADLAGLARLFLTRNSPKGIDVMLSGECTFERNDRYYSYRRHAITGRLATVAWLLPPRHSA